MKEQNVTSQHISRMHERLELIDFTAVDELFAQFHDSANGPLGVAYGIVHQGKVVHSGGCGSVAAGSSSTPDADTIFRIASLSKSFTAAAILSLRDEGLLQLIDPVSQHIPALASARDASADSLAVTIADCLTMSSGLPGDDAWADRQESMSPEQFCDLLSDGLVLAHTPGTRFEYSNLGFAILGRIVANVSGLSFPEFVADRILEPLGLDATTYDYRSVPPERLALGYRKSPEAGPKLPSHHPANSLQSAEFSALYAILPCGLTVSPMPSAPLNALTANIR